MRAKVNGKRPPQERSFFTSISTLTQLLAVGGGISSGVNATNLQPLRPLREKVAGDRIRGGTPLTPTASPHDQKLHPFELCLLCASAGDILGSTSL